MEHWKTHPSLQQSEPSQCTVDYILNRIPVAVPPILLQQLEEEEAKEATTTTPNNSSFWFSFERVGHVANLALPAWRSCGDNKDNNNNDEDASIGSQSYYSKYKRWLAQVLLASSSSVSSSASLSGVDNDDDTIGVGGMSNGNNNTNINTIQTVINKVENPSAGGAGASAAAVEILADDRKDLRFNRSATAVSFAESGVHLKFDLAEVCWSSWMAQERQRLIRDEFQQTNGAAAAAATDTDTDAVDTVTIADAFCGVGALLLQAVRQMRGSGDNNKNRGGRNVRIVGANDCNPAALAALRKQLLRVRQALPSLVGCTQSAETNAVKQEQGTRTEREARNPRTSPWCPPRVPGQ